MQMPSQIGLGGPSVFATTMHRPSSGPDQQRPCWFSWFMNRGKCLHPVVIQATVSSRLHDPYLTHMDVCVSCILIWSMASFIHSFTWNVPSFYYVQHTKARVKGAQSKLRHDAWPQRISILPVWNGGKNMTFMSQQTLAGGPPFWLLSCVILDNLLDYLKPEFLHLQNGYKQTQLHRRGIEVTMLSKLLWER